VVGVVVRSATNVRGSVAVVSVVRGECVIAVAKCIDVGHMEVAKLYKSRMGERVRIRHDMNSIEGL
jgi:hypothetical protein